MHRRPLVLITQATFKVTMTAPKTWVVKSNMPLSKTTSVSGGLTSHTFKHSPLMSTYLLAFTVGETVEQASTCKLMGGDMTLTHFAVPSG